MNPKAPPPWNLEQSSQWIKYKFGIKGHFRSALRHVNRCLDEIAGREYDLLMTKSSALACLERWEDLTGLLEYLVKRYPKDPEVMEILADTLAAHGDWETCRTVLKANQRRLDPKEHQHFINTYYSEMLEAEYVVRGRSAALRYGRRLVRRKPRLSGLKTTLKHLEDDVLRVESYAPEDAKYLGRLRRLAT